MSRAVAALIHGRGTTADAVADACGLSRSTLYNRLNRGNWHIDEVERVAAHFNAPIGSLINGLGGIFGPDPAQGDPGVTHQYRSSTLLSTPSPKVTRTSVAA